MIVGKLAIKKQVSFYKNYYAKAYQFHTEGEQLLAERTFFRKYPLASRRARGDLTAFPTVSLSHKQE